MHCQTVRERISWEDRGQMERMHCNTIKLKRKFSVHVFSISSPPNVLTESLIKGQTCSLRGIHRDVISHGLLENTIYKLCHKVGPPTEWGRKREREQSLFTKCSIQRKGLCKINIYNKIRIVIQTADNWTSVYLGYETGMLAHEWQFLASLGVILFCMSLQRKIQCKKTTFVHTQINS